MQDEISETLLKTKDFKLERIVSSGQATPPGKWYDQDTNEWVILLSGSAGLLMEVRQIYARCILGIISTSLLISVIGSNGRTRSKKRSG